MESQENTFGGVRPNLFPLQTTELPPGGASQMPITLVDPSHQRSQSSGHSSPLQALPTPPYSSWGTRTIPSSMSAPSRNFVPSTALRGSLDYGGHDRRGSTGITSFPSSVTLNASMSSSNPPAPVAPSDQTGFSHRQHGQQHGAPRHSSPDPSRRHQTDVQQRAAPGYMPMAHQPVQLQGWQQPLSTGPASALPHPSRRASLPHNPSTQQHSSQPTMMPDSGRSPALSSMRRQPDPVVADGSRRASTSGIVTSRPDASAANPYASPHAPSPTVPTVHGHPPQQYLPQTNQQRPVSHMYSLPPAGGFAHGGQPIRPQPQVQLQTQPPQILTQAQHSQAHMQRSMPLPAGSAQAQQQLPQQSQLRPLPNDHPAIQHSHKLVRMTGLYLERAYNAAILTISNELDRLDSQFRALKAEYQKVSAMHQQSEQEKAVLQEERTKLLDESAKEKAAHECSKAELAKVMNTGTQLVDFIRVRAAEFEKMKAEMERSEKINTVLVKSVTERFQSGDAGTSNSSGPDIVDMVQVGKWRIPKDLVSVLEDAVKGPLIQQYEQRFGEVMAEQARERAEHEKEVTLLRALLARSLPPQSQGGEFARTGPTQQIALPTTPYQPAPLAPQPYSTQPQPISRPQSSHHPQFGSHSQHGLHRQPILQSQHTPQLLPTTKPPSTPTSSTPTSDMLASRQSPTPLTLGPSLSRRREHLPLPLSTTYQSPTVSTSADDHGGSIPTPPRTATPSADTHEPSMFTIIKQEPIDAPNWPWLPGEVIDLTGFTDSPLPGDLPPLPLDIGQLEAQPSVGSEPMNIDHPQSPTQSERQSAPPDQLERKRSLSAQGDGDNEGSRKKMKMDNSDAEAEEDAVMEELMEQPSSEVDEPMERPEPDPPLISSPGPCETELPATSSPSAPESRLPDHLKPHTTDATPDDRTATATAEETVAPLPSPSHDLQPGLPAQAPSEGGSIEPDLSHVSASVVPAECVTPMPTESGPETASTNTTFESIVKAEPQDLSSLATALALPPSPKLSIRHLDLVYHTDKDKVVMSCRMCLARKQIDPEWAVKRFSTQAKWAELSGHCKNIHPRAFQELVGMTDAKVTETRQRLITGNR